jgi:hypothetical protein
MRVLNNLPAVISSRFFLLARYVYEFSILEIDIALFDCEYF